MNLKKLTLAIAAAAFAAPLMASSAGAELVIPSFTYRTGPYAPNGIPFADGYADYFSLLNERDGGIEGQKVKVIECETAYNTQQGVECYENTKGEGTLVIQPLSTGITYQLIPKATSDKIPVHSMGYGRTSAADGTVFPYVFNFPGTYWDAASIIVKHIGATEGSMDDLKGKKIALVYHNSAYGKEPIRTLEELAKKHGYELMLLPVDHPGQEQKATWLQVRRDRPDWVVMWGWGVMNQVAIKEAASVRFPMDRFVGVWWSASENDVLPAGKEADGYKAVAFHAPGTNFPLFADLQQYVVGAGKAAGDGSHVGEVLYNRGMVAALWASEAIRTAMKIHGTMNVTPDMVRDGYEAWDVDEARLAELGLPNFTVPVKVTCANHGGPGLGAIQQWDANSQTWSLITGYVPADREVVHALIAEDSAAFAKEAGITPRSCN